MNFRLTLASLQSPISYSSNSLKRSNVETKGSTKKISGNFDVIFPSILVGICPYLYMATCIHTNKHSFSLFSEITSDFHFPSFRPFLTMMMIFQFHLFILCYVTPLLLLLPTTAIRVLTLLLRFLGIDGRGGIKVNCINWNLESWSRRESRNLNVRFF